MGIVQFNGRNIYTGPIASFSTNHNWNNSMGEYYPIAYILYVSLNDEVVRYVLDVPEFKDPSQNDLFSIVLDADQVIDLTRIRDAKAKAIEDKVIRVSKEVVVVRGRKVPIGTTGRVFWMGNTKFGPSVGIETNSGDKHFTSQHNVEVVNVDLLFETQVLGKDKK